MTWQECVLRYGSYQPASYLAVIVGQPEAVIAAFKATRVMGRGRKRPYAEVFTAFRGRAPQSDADWPRPRLQSGHRRYEWLPNEDLVIASLVGRVSVRVIAATLTTRLRTITGDQTALRSVTSVQIRINRLGLQATDLVGGLTIRAVVRRSGETFAIVNQAVRAGRLKTFRVGHRHVIREEELQRWMASRDRPPAGWVRLTSVAKALQICSDSKLPEYAKAGYIPDTAYVRSVHLWFIAPDRAAQIIADARAGRPLPWHGKPFLTNLRASWRKWQQRKHRRCERCRTAWGPTGAPRSFDEFCRRYPTLDLGLKRHLTVQQRGRRTWAPRRPWGSVRAFRGRGLTIAQAARTLAKPRTWILGHIARGTIRPLRDVDAGEKLRISPAAMRRLRALQTRELRGRPRGSTRHDWIGGQEASELAGTSIAAIQLWDRQRKLTAKAGPRGRMFTRASVMAEARRSWARGWIGRRRDAEKPAWLVAEEQNGAAA